MGIFQRKYVAQLRKFGVWVTNGEKVRMEGGAQLHVWNMITVESGGTVVGCWKK